MIAAVHSSGPSAADWGLQRSFLALLPRVERHTRVYFRHLRCPAEREDAVAETVALAWQWHVRLARRGKDASRFAGALAGFAARAVRGGRGLCGQENSRDVLSRLARRRRRFGVKRLPECSSLGGDRLTEALTDNRRTPPDEQVVFRIDFPAWWRTRAERDRRILDALMVGERTTDVARRHGLSPGRISQLRREFHDDWQRFGATPGEA
jgi:hypothetical protein